MTPIDPSVLSPALPDNYPPLSPSPSLSSMASQRSADHQSVASDVPFLKSRGATACEKCRLRKTRCDNRRPSCGYCMKRRVACVYPDENDSGGSATGNDILQAINRLTSLVESQQQQQQQQISCGSCGAHSSLSLSWSQSASNQPEARHPCEPDSSPLYPAMRPQGVESILDWKIFASNRPAMCLFAQRNPPPNRNYPLPDTSYSELARLESKYIDDLHTKNPILDLNELHHMMLHVAENGLDWSMQTCLVTLVCAIAAISEPYPIPRAASEMQSTSSPAQKADHGAEMELSMQFWSLAMKRLGYAASQSSVQAVQCLCLADIWYMHRLQPLEAWKHFSLAGTAWHSLSLIEFPLGELINNAERSSSELTVMQALYFTIWKSESELRLELPLPSPPALDNTYFPLAFPQPPSLSAQPLNPETEERERSWYYYLTEIAARHLINRVLQMTAEIPDTPTETHLLRMIAQAEMMEAQVSDWYSSLPAMFYFDIPSGYEAEFHPDIMVFVLRHRYFTLRELITRPFVRLCVDQLVDQMHSSIRARAQAFASQSIQFCMLKLSQTVAHRHQGTWYMLRITASSSLILGAVHLAQCRAQESQAIGAFSVVQSLVLPEGWRARIRQAVELAEAYFDDPNGGASNLKETIRAILEAGINRQALLD